MLFFDCVIIGGGVAGMTAAMYLKRANLSVIIIDKGSPGGQLNNILKIDNYPGFLSIEGGELSQKIYEQITNLEIPFKYGTVLSLRNEETYKIVKTDMEEIKCQAIIIASGRSPKNLGLKNEKRLLGRGLSFCALCDGSFYKDKKVALIGGGNKALSEALYLAKICKEVVIIYKYDNFSATLSWQEKIKKKDNIKIEYNSEVIKLKEEDNKLKSIIIKNKKGEKEVIVEGLFVNIGYHSEAEYLTDLDLKMDNKYIVVDEEKRTNLKNIYACGDVIKKSVYQITTAVSDGTIAALSVKKDIN